MDDKDLYLLLGELASEVRAIKELLEKQEAETKECLIKQEEFNKDINTRVINLENKKYKNAFQAWILIGTILLSVIEGGLLAYSSSTIANITNIEKVENVSTK